MDDDVVEGTTVVAVDMGEEEEDGLETEDEVLTAVPFSRVYNDNSPEPPQYSCPSPTQTIVHPPVWFLPDTPPPNTSTLIVYPQ